MLLEITEKHHDVVLDIRYATSDNFIGKPVYARAACFLHEDAIQKLTKAVTLAYAQGYKIKIFDAFRPLEVQRALWDHTPDENFLSNPETGSCPHCRGVAVDVTLLDYAGKALDMGTAFDAFTPHSHHGSTEITPQAQANRYLLLGIMLSAGWDFYRNEWWHYQLFSPRNYPLVTDAEINAGMTFPTL